MRHDKIVARTLLISFVVNVALAAPVAVRQRLLHPDGAGAASEKRLNSDGESELAASAAGEPFHLPDSGSWADTRARIPLELFGVVRRPTLRVNRISAPVASSFGRVAAVATSRGRVRARVRVRVRARVASPFYSATVAAAVTAAPW